MAKLKKTKSKSRKPKGKRLSEKLREKDEAKAVDAGADEDDDDAPAPPAEDESEDDEAPAPDDDDEAPAPGDGDDDDDEPPPSEIDEDDDDEEEEYDDDDEAAAQMGHQRYVIAGFFGLWLVVGFICGATLELIWSRFAAKDWFVEAMPQLAAIPHEGELYSRATLSMVVGAVIGAAIVLRYYTRPDIRQWADEVAEELGKVKWPTRKEVGNNTVVVMIASAIITLYLTLLDRFWDFVTTLIYSSGT